MTARRGVPAGRWPTMSWAILALLLGGLFAMHGLATHGSHAAPSTHSGSSAASATVTGSAVATDQPSVIRAAIPINHAMTSEMAVDAGLGTASDRSGSVVQVCLAVISVATLLLLILLSLLHRRTPLRLRRVTSGLGRFARLEADPRPLRRSQLAIWRC